MDPKGECTGQTSKLKRKCIICHNSQAQSKYAFINLIHPRHIQTVCLFYVISKTFTKFKISLNITWQNKITCVANEFTLRAHESTLRNAHACVSVALRNSECNCTEIMHTHYFQWEIQHQKLHVQH